MLLQQWGATTEALPSGVLILVGGEHKRETIEKLWAAGYEVFSLRPVKGSLEELYMTLVGSGGGLA